MTAGREPTSPTDKRLFKCKSSCGSFCHYCARAIAIERFKSRASSLYYQRLQIKICEKCFVCHSIVSCQFCFRCTKCCPKSSCRSQTSKFWGNLARSGSRTKNNPEFEGRLCPPLPGPTQTHKISHSHKLLCQSHRNSYLLEALHQLIDKNTVELVQNPTSLGFFNRLFLVPNPTTNGDQFWI